MADGFIQLPADSTGKKLRTVDRGAGGHDQYVSHSSDATYIIYTGSLACAGNKLFLSFLNNAASGQVLKVRKLFIINTTLPAVVGVGVEFQVKRISAIVGGTAVTPNPTDTADGALANVTCVHTATGATEGVILYPWITNNDEVGLTNAFPTAAIQACQNTLPTEDPDIRNLTLRAGEGVCVKQITASAVGTFGVLATVTKE